MKVQVLTGRDLQDRVGFDECDSAPRSLTREHPRALMDIIRIWRVFGRYNSRLALHGGQLSELCSAMHPEKDVLDNRQGC